ncbi:MAG TPA: carboxypeptidase-like regulatory domain-containing protein, partial [Beijerinckiaceae bacterium]|nr:carboxypeptidase-like regulatory domain-containing protein [Beijerinckiaceae bacterium]
MAGFALALALGAWAQTTSTEILGTVTDASGAAVPGAKVTLLRPATGEVRTTVTADDGNYSFPLIDVGEYVVRVEAKSFKTQEQKDIAVQLQQKARIDVRLEVGLQTETVSVTAAAVSIKTEDATVGSNIDNKRVVELPLNGRNVATLAVLVPGVQYGVRMGLDGSGGFPIPGNGVAISANG